MPIYEFACPKCRKIYNFFSQRVNPAKSPKCPKCGNKKLIKQMSGFAMTRGTNQASPPDASRESGPGMPDFDDPRVARMMGEMEREMANVDENNPKHMAHLMRKMKDIMPAGTAPKELETAIKRLEAGEDMEKIEADMGDIFGGMTGGEEGESGGAGGYSQDGGLYDY